MFKGFWSNFLVIFILGLSGLYGLTSVQSQVVKPVAVVSFCVPTAGVNPCRALAAGGCGGLCTNNSPGTVNCSCKPNVQGQPGGPCKCWAT